MSVNPMSLANGADLLKLYTQAGQGAAAVTASVDVLKAAMTQAQLSASEIIASNSDGGSQINLYV
jgi:hypothetical protein